MSSVVVMPLEDNRWPDGEVGSAFRYSKWEEDKAAIMEKLQDVPEEDFKPPGYGDADCDPEVKLDDEKHGFQRKRC